MVIGGGVAHCFTPADDVADDVEFLPHPGKISVVAAISNNIDENLRNLVFNFI
jgi:hypothetical protein